MHVTIGWNNNAALLVKFDLGATNATFFYEPKAKINQRMNQNGKIRYSNCVHQGWKNSFINHYRILPYVICHRRSLDPYIKVKSIIKANCVCAGAKL